MEAQTRDVGFAVGKAYSCLAEDAQRQERVKQGAKLIYTMILQDLGSDLAFAFATSAGYGSGQPREETDCQELSERWEAIKEHFDITKLFEEDTP